MKILPYFILFLSLNTTFYAQKNVVKIVPTNLIRNTFTLQYERVLTDKKSLLISLNYMSKNYFYGVFSYNVEGFGIETAMKYAVGKKQLPEGWYFSPMIGSGRLYASSLYREEMGTYLQVGNSVGHQWLFGGKDSKFSFDVFGGLGLVYFKNDKYDYIHCTGLVRRLGIGLGYAF